MIVALMFALPATVLSQQERQVRLLEDENLIEATYYYESGKMSQQGTFTLDGKLHGNWVSYAEDGRKVAMGTYVEGKRQGKWFFWEDDLLREVDYQSNAVASVQEWKSTSRLALQD